MLRVGFLLLGRSLFIWRTTSHRAILLIALSSVFVPSGAATAADIPMTIDFDDFGPRSVVATLDSGQLHGSLKLRTYTVTIEGNLREGKLYINIHGAMSFQAMNWGVSCSAEANTDTTPGHVDLNLDAVCHGNAPNTSLRISLDLSSLAATPATTAAPQPVTQAAAVPVSVPAAMPPAQATSPQPAVAALDFGNYQALVIGNDNYRNGLPSLKTARADAQAIAATLASAYGFKVTLLLNASREQIIGTLAKLRKALTWDDNLLIYYAGHGSYDDAADQGYWLPVDAAPDDPTNWVSNTDLTNMMKAMQARHVMVVADSCYSGTLTRDANVGIRGSDYIQRMVQKKARTVMTSGGLEPVADSGGSGHSVFAAAFIAALQQNSGVMDAQSFFALVREPVVLASPQTPEYSNLRFAGHEGGDFVFVRKE